MTAKAIAAPAPALPAVVAPITPEQAITDWQVGQDVPIDDDHLITIARLGEHGEAIEIENASRNDALCFAAQVVSAYSIQWAKIGKKDQDLTLEAFVGIFIQHPTEAGAAVVDRANPRALRRTLKWLPKEAELEAALREESIRIRVAISHARLALAQRLIETAPSAARMAAQRDSDISRYLKCMDGARAYASVIRALARHAEVVSRASA